MRSTPRNLILLALSGTALLLTSLHGRTQSPAFDDRTKVHEATVTIMALTSYTHQGFAGNQDNYLAEISLKKGEHEYARLRDFYSSSASPIRRSLLTERQVFHMRLQRTPDCDATAHDILIATRESNIFDGGTRTAVGQSDQAIPCYRIEHNATRLAKK